MNTQMPLAGTLVISDMDRALLTPEGDLPPVTRAALERFCALGGSFTVATRRGPASAERLLARLPVNAPVILLDGGLILDHRRSLTLNAHYLPRGRALALLGQLRQAFPALGFVLLAENRQLYVLKATAAVEQFRCRAGAAAVWADAEKVPGRWLRVLAIGPAVQCRAAQRFGRRFAVQKDLAFARTPDGFLEILPPLVDRGTALRSLCRMQGISQQAVAAIGGTAQDRALLKAAGFAAAVGNAPLRVQCCADLVTGRCENGGAAQFLFALMQHRTERGKKE